MKHYNLVWDSQSTRSADSMPLGGHDLGCNVWVEQNTVYVYFCKSDGIDENGTLLKIGRIGLRFSEGDNILERNFRQKLDLETASLRITAGDGDDRIAFTFWAAVTKSELHIDFDSTVERDVHLSWENWRYRDRIVEGEERHQCRGYDYGFPGDVITRADRVEAKDGRLISYHDNQSHTSWMS